jgi:hypothetical protein
MEDQKVLELVEVDVEEDEVTLYDPDEDTYEVYTSKELYDILDDTYIEGLMKEDGYIMSETGEILF